MAKISTSPFLRIRADKTSPNIISVRKNVLLFTLYRNDRHFHRLEYVIKD